MQIQLSISAAIIKLKTINTVYFNEARRTKKKEEEKEEEEEARFYVKRTNRDISETALPITETKKRKHFAIQSTPQNLGKLTSETTFGHSKVVFRPLLRTKRTFSQNPPMSRF